MDTDAFIKKTLVRAGEAALKLFGKVGVHYMKSDNVWDCVTKADLLSEKIIISAIQKHYPDHGIIAEESGRMNAGAEYVWIIDPIDGTLNFSRGIPLFGVMMCLARRGKVILSAIYLPVLKEFFFAKAGKGAYLNGKRIHCSRKATLEQSFGTGSSSLRGRTVRFLRTLLAKCKKDRLQMASFGSICVNTAYVACGRRDWAVLLSGQ
ncbi:hypothetical protein HY090_00270, partial [Candidatus Kaiserbacteria bacterium]|nr:hypothetical protein [Candidatus Kaiserbacteria bacterium]